MIVVETIVAIPGLTPQIVTDIFDACADLSEHRADLDEVSAYASLDSNEVTVTMVVLTDHVDAAVRRSSDAVAALMQSATVAMEVTSIHGDLIGA